VALGFVERRCRVCRESRKQGEDRRDQSGEGEEEERGEGRGDARGEGLGFARFQRG